MGKIFEIPEELIKKREAEDLVQMAKERGELEAKPEDYTIDDWKCGGCNWQVEDLFVIAESQEEAEKIFMAHDGGLCRECITDLLAEEHYQVTAPKEG